MCQREKGDITRQRGKEETGWCKTTRERPLSKSTYSEDYFRENIEREERRRGQEEVI